jgi:hypothetical protein
MFQHLAFSAFGKVLIGCVELYNIKQALSNCWLNASYALSVEILHETRFYCKHQESGKARLPYHQGTQHACRTRQYPRWFHSVA